MENEIYEEDEIFSDEEYKLVLTVVKTGFEGEVVEAANQVGSKGGILIQAKGISREQSKLLGMNFNPENSLVLILVKKELVVPVMKSIYSIASFKSEAHGMVFALPVSMVAGMNELKIEEKDEEKKH